MPGYRLPRGGTRVDRKRSFRFTFDNASVAAFVGDTVASALIASGRTTIGRSFKYHRARGVYSAGAEEPNALVTLGEGSTEPNTKATVLEAIDGLQVASQNAWPSLGFDVSAINQLASPFLGAGFYYKTFMGPGRRGWMLYEPSIRRAAGLGKASFEADPDRYDQANAFCDILVVGGGPAGLSAALIAGRSGAKVILCDDQLVLGGGLDLEDRIGERDPADWLFETTSALKALPNVRVFTRTSVYGYYDDNVLGALEHVAPGARTRLRHWRIAARHAVLAPGAIERPFVFSGNDRPGVMLASATLAYARRYGVSVGRDVVIFTNNDSGWQRALALLRAGTPIRAVIDPRSAGPTPFVGAIREMGTQCLSGSVVVEALGSRALKSVKVAGFDRHSGKPTGAERDLKCDALAISAGWSPLVHLASQAGAPPAYSEALHAFVPGEPRERWVAAGAVRGVFDAAEAASDGARAGAEAAIAIGFTPSDGSPSFGNTKASPSLNMFPLFEIEGKGKAFVDLQNDVTASDVRLAQREGFESVEHLKRYTTLGMAADQGKTSNLNGLTILAAARGLPIPAVGTTRFRPPYNPVSLGALAGRARGSHMAPLRRVPLHDVHIRAGADMFNVGPWQRPRIYAKSGETLEQAYVREARAVRTSVGITDVSTLGKIDVQGPDAATFLDRVYTNPFSTLPIGKARYGLMLRDDGFLYDDGTTWRLGETRYLMTTTTASAALVYQNLEMLLSIVWPELRVYCTSVTEQWATIALVGPRSRDVLAALAPDLAVDTASFPFLTWRDTDVARIATRVCRISFSGELAYELNVSWWDAPALWAAVLDAGASLAITTYGTETMHVLRAEKGYPIIGQDTDGTVTPQDLGLGWAVSKKKPDFIGKRSFARADTSRDDRKQLVGLLPDDGATLLPEGAHLVTTATLPEPPVPTLGHVTSSYHSAALGRTFALALIRGGRDRIGQRLYAPLGTGLVPVTVTSSVLYDPEGARRDG
jgi:sarcosine oxidase subunit alpha